MNIKKRFSSKKLHFKIFLSMSLLLVFFTGLISLIWYHNASRALRESTITSLTSTIESVNLQLDGFLNVAVRTANSLPFSNVNFGTIIRDGPYDDEMNYLSTARQLDQVIQSAFAYTDYVIGVSIISQNDYVYKAGMPIIRGNYYKYDFVDEILSGDYAMIYIRHNATDYPVLISSKEALSFLTPIRQNRETIGAVMIDIDFDMISDIYDVQVVRDYMRVISVLPDGEILYDSQDPAEHRRFNSISDSPMAAVFTDDVTIPYSDIITINDESYLLVRFQSERTSITTAGIVPISYLESNIRRTLGLTAILAVSLSILSVGISYILAISTTRRLQRLSTTIDEIVGHEDIDKRASVEGQDQIADLAVTFNGMMDRVQRLISEVSMQEKENREVEMALYQVQIDPHFIYNSLNTVRYLATLRGASNIDEVAASLTRLLRFSLEFGTRLIPLQQEIDFVDSYMVIQQYRYLDSLHLIKSIDPETLKAKIPRLIIQPLIENSLQHGYLQSEPGFIYLTVTKIESEMKDRLSIVIRDNGAGMELRQIKELLERDTRDSPIKMKGSHHLGLHNVMHRIHLYFGESASMNIQSQVGKYTEITIEIPFVLGEDETEPWSAFGEYGRGRS